MEQWRAGDRDAGDALIAQYFEFVCRFFRSKLGDDVDDLVQRVFLDCVESRGRIRDGGFRAYLAMIAHNRLMDHLRAKYRTPELVDVASLSVRDLGTTPTQRLAKNQRQELLLQALQHISVEQQILLELAYWEDLTGPEIAEVLGIEPNTVRSRLSRARATLREVVETLARSPAQAIETMDELPIER